MGMTGSVRWSACLWIKQFSGHQVRKFAWAAFAKPLCALAGRDAPQTGHHKSAGRLSRLRFCAWSLDQKMSIRRQAMPDMQPRQP
jgi:hypothetical protein